MLPYLAGKDPLFRLVDRVKRLPEVPALPAGLCKEQLFTQRAEAEENAPLWRPVCALKNAAKGRGKAPKGDARR